MSAAKEPAKGASTTGGTADEGLLLAPRGLEGVVVADTNVGDVRGKEGFYHYREYSAIDLARGRSFEDVAHLMLRGRLPGSAESIRFASELAGQRQSPGAVATIVSGLSVLGGPMDTLRTAVSALGTELKWQPVLDLDPGTLQEQVARLIAVAPTMLAAGHRTSLGLDPVAPRTDLGHVANYLWMLSGSEPTAEHARALEQYLIVAIDHGFNASTFAARVIASTGADLASAICGAVGALAGPLHGGAPGRALDMLDEVRATGDASEWVRAAVGRGDRVMGFGHRVYKTDDPRVGLPAGGRPGPRRSACGRGRRGGTRGRRHASGAQAGAEPLRQRRVLRRDRDGEQWSAEGAVHADVRDRPARRVVCARARATSRQSLDPTPGPLRRAASARAGATAVGGLRGPVVGPGLRPTACACVGS